MFSDTRSGRSDLRHSTKAILKTNRQCWLPARAAVGNCADKTATPHLGHESDRHTQHDRPGAVARSQHASRVEQFVADNFRDEDCSR
jgi:hypothetical protein